MTQQPLSNHSATTQQPLSNHSATTQQPLNNHSATTQQQGWFTKLLSFTMYCSNFSTILVTRTTTTTKRYGGVDGGKRGANLKKGWVLIAFTAFSPFWEPSRLAGSLVRNYRRGNYDNDNKDGVFYATNPYRAWQHESKKKIDASRIITVIIMHMHSDRNLHSSFFFY
jgi:hypothetical protein